MDPFACPRCGSTVTERFYGPCTSCRESLRASLGTEPVTDASAPTTVAFEPKLNVVPNHVATKD